MFERDLDQLLSGHPTAVAALAREMIALVQSIRPDFTVRVAKGWQTVNFHHAQAGFINAIYLSRPGQVLLIFQDGRLLDHPLLTDDGKVKKVRWMSFAPGDAIPADDIAILIAEAVALRI